MPRIESRTIVSVSADSAFAVSQSRGEVRYAWDPFVASQTLLHGATGPGKGVQTSTRSRHRLSMVTEYTSFRRPTQVGMKQVSGPWFFDNFAAGWSFKDLDDGTCEATWRYTFSVRPSWLAVIADRVGVFMLQRDIDRRISRFADACANPDLVDRALTQLGPAPGDELHPGV